MRTAKIGPDLRFAQRRSEKPAIFSCSHDAFRFAAPEFTRTREGHASQ